MSSLYSARLGPVGLGLMEVFTAKARCLTLTEAAEMGGLPNATLP